MTSAFNLSAFSGASVFSSNNKDSNWYENISFEQSKEIIRDKIFKAADNFCAIGYYLKNIREKEFYKEAGFKDIYEFAYTEFNFSQSTCIRYMQMNDEFSLGGNSPELAVSYEKFSISQLMEMLPLPEEKRLEISDTATVKEIREIKIKEKEKSGPSLDDINNLIDSQFLNNKKFSSINDLKSFCIDNYGKTYAVNVGVKVAYECTPRGISINSSEELTWNAFCKKIWDYIPKKKEIKKDLVPTIIEDVKSNVYELTDDEKEEYKNITENSAQIEMFSREKHVALMKNMFSKSEEEINEMFNSGMFNEIVKGFTAMLLSEGGLSDEAIKEKIRAMDGLFDEVTAGEARKFYKSLG